MNNKAGNIKSLSAYTTVPR